MSTVADQGSEHDDEVASSVAAAHEATDISEAQRQRLYAKWLEQRAESAARRASSGAAAGGQAGEEDGSESGQSFGSDKHGGKTMPSEAHNSRSSKRSQHSRGASFRARKAARAAAHREEVTGDKRTPQEFRQERAEQLTGIKGSLALIMWDFWIKSLPTDARCIGDLLEQARQAQFVLDAADLDLITSRLMTTQIAEGNTVLKALDRDSCVLCGKHWQGQQHETSKYHVEKVASMAMLDSLLGKPLSTHNYPRNGSLTVAPNESLNRSAIMRFWGQDINLFASRMMQIIKFRGAVFTKLGSSGSSTISIPARCIRACKTQMVLYGTEVLRIPRHVRASGLRSR